MRLVQTRRTSGSPLRLPPSFVTALGQAVKPCASAPFRGAALTISTPAPCRAGMKAKGTIRSGQWQHVASCRTSRLSIKARLVQLTSRRSVPSGASLAANPDREMSEPRRRLMCRICLLRKFQRSKHTRPGLAISVTTCATPRFDVLSSALWSHLSCLRPFRGLGFRASVDFPCPLNSSIKIGTAAPSASRPSRSFHLTTMVFGVELPAKQYDCISVSVLFTMAKTPLTR